MTKNVSTSDCNIINSSVNRVDHAVAQSRDTTEAVGFNLDDILARIGQRNNQGVETGTGGNHSAIHKPIVMGVSLCIGHVNASDAIRANIGAADSGDHRSCRSGDDQHVDGVNSGTSFTISHIHGGGYLVPSVS